ncbi:MAG: hypothetical protein II007_13455 [Gammaproteobacteria bacterium]|nr:hypothetical protein [Gammaproteobacteria bacterium]
MSNLIIRLCKAAKDTDGPLGDLLIEAAESISEKCTIPEIKVNKDVLGGRTVTVGNVSVAGVKSVIFAVEMVEMIEIRHDRAMRELAEKRKELADLKAAISRPADGSPLAAGIMGRLRQVAAGMQTAGGKSVTMITNGGPVFSVTRMRDQEADQQAELAAGAAMPCGTNRCAQAEPPTVWQYYFRPHLSHQDPTDDECWHDEGTGPLRPLRSAGYSRGLAWRPKPPTSCAEPQSTTAAQTAEPKDQR